MPALMRRIVLFGESRELTGWSPSFSFKKAVALMKQLHQGDYHVTVIAPQNYSLFTPLLPSATVGTVEARSLVEPLRRTLARVK